MQVLRHRLLSGGAWAFGGKLVTAILVLAINAFLARLLPPQELGAYFLAYTIVLFGTQLGSLGLNRAVVRFVAESIALEQPRRARQTVKLTLYLGTLGAVGVGTAYLFFGSFLAENVFNSSALGEVSGLVAGWITVMIFQALISESFRGLHDIRLATIFGGATAGIGLMMGGLLAVSLLIFLLVNGRADLDTIILLALGAGLATVVLAGMLLRRKVASLPSGDRDSQMRTEDLVRTAWPLLIIGVAFFSLRNGDIWIVGVFRPQEDVALYGAALRMVVLVATPLLIMNSVVPPMIAEMYAQGRLAELQRVVRATATLAGLPAFLVLVIFIVAGGPILEVIYGDYYRQAALVLAILSIGKLTAVWSGACEIVLMMTGNQKTLLIIALVTTTGVVPGAVWAAQDYGTVGVASVAAGGLCFQNCLTVLFVRKKLGIWTHIDLRLHQLRKAFVE